MSDFSNPIFHDEAKAREWLERQLWPDGPYCPRCGAIGQATLMRGNSHRPGLYQCNACREPFSVTVGTMYKGSKVPLNKWLAAEHLMMAGEKGMSARQIGRLLGLSKKTAWFLCHRIRQSFRARLTAAFTDGKSFVLRLEPKLRSDFEALMEKYSSPVGELTPVAAAADGNWDGSRRIAGGFISLHSFPKHNDVMIDCVLDWPVVPHVLHLEGADGEIAWETLPEPREDGSSVIIKRLDDDEGRRFVRLLREERTKAAFRRIKKDQP